MTEREPSYYKANAHPRMFGSLQEAHDRLDAIIESSYDGIYITDGQAVTIRVNRAYEIITGLRADEVLGRSMWKLEEEGIIDRSGTLIALAKRKPVTLEQTFKTGKRALITSTPTFDENGDVVMVVTNVRDITEFHDLQERFRESEALTQRYSSEVERIRRQVLDSADLIAVDSNMLETLRLAERVAGLDATVLLLGETGVGKDKVAKYIYKSSPRRDAPFITVNCGAIPPTLMESELFGYEKGAFTGANREGKLGIFELADGGTLFLDEVGELPLDMQVKLLRVLQERQVERIGGGKSIAVDVRLLAATNRNLEDMVREKSFRDDLYYRLNVVPITIVPLRKRPDDILPFAHSFLAEYNKKYGMTKTFTPSALQAMLEYPWPGNVRELRNVVERMVIVTSDDCIRAADLPFARRWEPTAGLFGEEEGKVALKDLVAQFESQFLQRAYKKHGNVRAAAASLGMDAATFVRKRKKYEQTNKLDI